MSKRDDAKVAANSNQFKAIEKDVPRSKQKNDGV